MSSCGASHYLKKAERSIAKAKEKGAVVKTDTTFHTFKIEGAKGQFDLGDIVLNRKDNIHERPILKDTVIYKDRIRTEIKDNKIFVECPDEEKEVPVAVTTEISAGYTVWDLIKMALFGAVVGFILGKVIKL